MAGPVDSRLKLLFCDDADSEDAVRLRGLVFDLVKRGRDAEEEGVPGVDWAGEAFGSLLRDLM